MISHTIHNIKTIEQSDPTTRQTESGRLYTSFHLEVKTDSGELIDITFFSPDPKALIIKHV